MNDLKKDIRAFVVENFLFGQGEGLSDADSFLDQGIVDSTGVLELVAHVEKTYGIKVKDDEMIPENLDSINAICGYLDSKKTVASS